MLQEEFCSNCPISFSGVNKPKVLHCGHSFCITCICKIQDKKCQVCGSICSDEELLNPPTNVSLEMVLRRKETNFHTTTCVTTRFPDIKELILDILPHMDESAPFYRHYNTFINYHYHGFSDMKKVIKNPFNSILTTMGNIQICLQAEDFNHRATFLTTIVEFLKRDYIFYAAHQVGNEILYGKLSLNRDWNDTLFIHSLTEKTHEREANIVWFEDLKYCLKDVVFWTFIKVKYLLMVFTMLDLSVASEFVKKCTGEIGATYKGLFYSSKVYDDIAMYSLNGYYERESYTENLFDYNIGLYVEPQFFNNCFVLQRLDNGGFNIIMCGEYDISHGNIIGIMNDYSYLKTKTLQDFMVELGNEDCVSDCGIAVLI